MKAHETHTIWRKAAASASDGNCIEIAELPGGLIGVRDGKDRGGPVLRFTAPEWEAFVDGVCGGGFVPVEAPGFEG